MEGAHIHTMCDVNTNVCFYFRYIYYIYIYLYEENDYNAVLFLHKCIKAILSQVPSIDPIISNLIVLLFTSTLYEKYGIGPFRWY